MESNNSKFKQQSEQSAGIPINGKYIIPEHGPEVINSAAFAMIRKGLIKDVNNVPINMQMTNFYVYHSLKAGAKRAGVKFPDTLTELWQIINLNDYNRVVMGYQKENGIEPPVQMDEEQLN